MVAAIGLSFLIVFVSRYWLMKTVPPAQPKAPVAQAVVPPVPAPEAKPAAPSPPPAAGEKRGTSELQSSVDSPLYKIVISSRGAAVKSWALNRYRDEQNNFLDLVDSFAAKQYGNPFSIWVSDEAIRQELNNALFVPSESGELHAPATLIYEYSTGRIAARKEISFNAKDYVVEIKTDVWSDGKAIAHSVAWPGGFGDVHALGQRGNQLDAYYRDPLKITRWTSGDIKAGTLSASGSFLFAGIEDRFFTATFLPQEGPLRVAALRQDVAVAGQTKPRQSLGLTVSAGEGQQNRLRVFVGPKDTDVLAAVEPHLAETVDYGWFAIVAKPLFVAMRWIHDHIVSNYGWAIILLTVFINFLLFPLKLKSLRSSMKMQRIQPQMRAIQDKYKQYKMNDPRKQEMQREMMALYKEHGVNPIGGCLPMVIQMPFLYGFYKVLVVSIEMRHAPWIFWIHDLSEPEKLPIKLLPLAMTATQFVLQKMSPSPSPDPAQQKMMMFMPIMFLLMFWNLSSGLVLYWLTGNIVGIAQQWFINQTEMKEAYEKKKSAKAGKKQAVARK